MYYCENYLAGIGVMICQMGYLNRIYKPLMLQILLDMDPETYVQRLTMSYAYSTAFNTIILYIIGFCLQKAYIDELRIAEGKREHLQKQKHFLLSFSSELRNLVQHMAGNIQMALLEEITQKVRDYLENSEAGIRLLLSMINNILDTGKIQVGELEINSTPVVFQETLEKMWGVCSYLLKEKNLAGSLRIDKKIPQMLKIDEYRLMQIFLNLIGNAVKYTEKGSVNIILEWRRGIHNEVGVSGRQFESIEKNHHIESEDPYITIGTESRKWNRDEGDDDFGDESTGLLKIKIIDTGCGIEAEKLGTIFERHSQDQTDIKARLSPGLGLYITKQLCNRMGGDINVSSIVDEGTTFVTCLPVEPVKAEKAGRIMTIGSFTELANWWKFRVLVVDDMNFNINILSNYFKKLGLPTTDIAQNGQEAVEKYIQYALEGNRFQIVTMDVEMPKMNGKEAAHKIREFEKKWKLKPCLLIMVSGNCSESEINECLIKDGEIGADYFLKKPATFDDLFNVVSRHFSSIK